MTPQMFSPSILSAVCAGTIPSPNVYEKVLTPVSLSASTAEPYRVAVSWSAVPGAETYCIAWATNGITDFCYADNLSKTLGYMSPGTVVSIYVKAENKMDVSLPSETVLGIAASNEEIENRAASYEWTSVCTLATNPINQDGTINYDKLNMDHDGDGMPSFQECIAGSDPLDCKSVFTAKIAVRENGNPEVSWEPSSPALLATRVYRTFGKVNLADSEWVDVTDKDKTTYRFFKVAVDLP